MKAKIGLFGFGVVGQGFYHILSQKNGTAPGHIARICVRDRAKTRPLPAQHFTFEAGDILNDPEITHIVELTDQADDAFQIVRTALERGKIVISANKRMLSERMTELLAVQRDSAGTLLYEASACGSIPIFRNLEQFYAHDEIQSIQGVFNGSTNYILTQMAGAGLDFQQALTTAQALGFAETDPALDIDAHDPAAKLALLSAHALGHFLAPDHIFRFGIRTIGKADVEFAAARGRKIRLLGVAQKISDATLQAFVMPVAVAAGDPFYNLEHEYNGVLIQSKYMENQLLTGKGAGGLPTGFAVLSDLVASVQPHAAGYKNVLKARRIVPDQSQLLRIYLRLPDAIRRDMLPEIQVESEQFTAAGLQLIGQIRLAELAEARESLLNAGAFAARWEAP